MRCAPVISVSELLTLAETLTPHSETGPPLAYRADLDRAVAALTALHMADGTRSVPARAAALAVWLLRLPPLPTLAAPLALLTTSTYCVLCGLVWQASFDDDAAWAGATRPWIEGQPDRAWITAWIIDHSTRRAA